MDRIRRLFIKEVINKLANDQRMIFCLAIFLKKSMAAAEMVFFFLLLPLYLRVFKFCDIMNQLKSYSCGVPFRADII